MRRSTWLAEVLRRSWNTAVHSARLAVGVPDYEIDAAHVRAQHPDREPMDRKTFVAERMQARYGKGRSRCC